MLIFGHVIYFIGETIVRYNTVEQSLDCRDATAKVCVSHFSPLTCCMLPCLTVWINLFQHSLLSNVSDSNAMVAVAF